VTSPTAGVPNAHDAATVVVAAAGDGSLGERLAQLTGARIVPVRSEASALEALEAHPAEMLVVDADALGEAAFALVSAAHERWPGLPVLLQSAAPVARRELTLLAAAEVELCAASSDEELRLGYQKALARSRRAETALPPPRSDGLLLGQSPAIRRVASLIEKVGPTSATVLIRGESGTGKELVARALHEASALAAAPFVKIDCTSLPEALLESELFGYEKGAFTGATARKLGRVELASGGTLFMDELGELSLPTQAKLLRLLQDRQIERLGGTRTIDVDVRVLAATHRDLESMVERGQFRQDLFYRLNVVPIWLPPLRARRDDISDLAYHFCRSAALRNGRTGTELTPGAVALLRAERWPGNVRQLANFVERLVVLSGSERIDEAAVRAELDHPVQFTTDLGGVAAPPGVPPPAPSVGDASSLERATARGARAAAPLADAHLSEVVRDAERAALLRALERSSGNRSDAARLLGVSRSTFYAKLKQYGLL
jgi:two-component system, NtrC family, response regulator AtoC